MESTEPLESTGPRHRSRWAAMLSPTSPVLTVEFIVFGTWGILAPYVGRPFGLIVDALPLVEVVDHVVPGALVLAAAAISLVTGRRSFAASVAVMVAGVWMTATHVPLLVQAANGVASMPAALFHSIPGMVLLVLGAVATLADVLTPRT